MDLSSKERRLANGPAGLIDKDSYALLDAAQGDEVRRAISESGLRSRSLYDGRAAARFESSAPYLVRLEPGPSSARLLERAWGRSWAVLFKSEVSFALLRSHLRHFLFVQTHEGRSLYFRFYDPRVLRVFLPLTSAQQRAALFAVPTEIAMESQDPDKAIVYRRTGASEPVLRRLRIIPEQMAGLAAATERIFEGRVAAFLRNTFPEARALEPAALDSFVRAQLTRGRLYALETEQELVTYVIAAWLLGPDFDERLPPARASLRSKIAPRWKAEWLARWAPTVMTSRAQEAHP